MITEIDVLSYYHEHKQEIEQYILENREALCKGPKVANTLPDSVEGQSREQ